MAVLYYAKHIFLFSIGNNISIILAPQSPWGMCFEEQQVKLRQQVKFLSCTSEFKRKTKLPKNILLLR